METIIGIDLGTTNSAVCVVREGKTVVISDRGQDPILPSVVGLTSDGQLLVGEAARNQALVAPERTVKSIKRMMGQEERVQLADREFSPQEISAMILRTLKERAEAYLGHAVSKAVITVPAFFSENQREATREAGELAGLEVARIINEPTAATLVYEPHTERNEKLLVYDLGGGTFDVSLVQIEQGVIEVLASHGDTHLGGDDFDQLLLDYVCEQFHEKHEIDLQAIPVARSRLLQAVEQAKKTLSSEAVATIAEEFIAEKDGKSLNLLVEVDRIEYEQLIEPLLAKTIECVDAAFADAGLTAEDIDRVVLVGGSSRTPLVHHLLKNQLHHEPHVEIDPDLCVAMGAGVQGALIAGVDVGAVLIDITPHTLGIRCLGDLQGRRSDRLFSPVIARNTALPATRSEIYWTSCDGQEAACIHVLQGEHDDVSFNESVGEFTLEGLREDADVGNQILVRFDLNLDGILTVTAIERETGLEKKLKIDNVITRFRASDQSDAKSRLADVFGESPVDDDAALVDPAVAEETSEAEPAYNELVTKARRLIAKAATEDADEMRELMDGIQQAQAAGDQESLNDFVERLEDLLFYVEDA